MLMNENEEKERGGLILVESDLCNFRQQATKTTNSRDKLANKQALKKPVSANFIWILVAAPHISLLWKGGGEDP